MTDPNVFAPKEWLVDADVRKWWGGVLDDQRFRTILTTALAHYTMQTNCRTPDHVDGARGMAEALLGLLEATESRRVKHTYDYTKQFGEDSAADRV